MKIQELKGVGPKIVKYLNSLGLYTVKDAIEFYPRDYEDRNNFKPIPMMQDAEMVSIIARVSIIQPGRRTATGKFMNKVVFENDTGFIVGVWFNQPYIKNNFTIGDTVLLYGKISRKLGEIQIIEPQYERDFESSSRGILPVYSSNKYLSQKNLRKIISQALAYIDREVDECLPESIRRVYELPDIKSAIVNLHYPSDFKMLNISEKRIKFEELLILQLTLFSAKQQYTNFNNAYSIQIHSSLRDFKESLPFELTGAQSRTIREVLMDLKKMKPMNRLVQGDVGSGKTIVAITALFNCAMNGFQGAMMAPTEILAEQHYKSIEGLTSKWGIKTALITGSTPKKEKDRILHELALGEIKIVIGTHALIQENVGFYNLALVITDEQHRFGVRQRAELISKGHDPHVLVMTATPIPRTLALFLYGDMDIWVRPLSMFLGQAEVGGNMINRFEEME
jgi:ATP-dependent DNA helicase RecG